MLVSSGGMSCEALAPWPLAAVAASALHGIPPEPKHRSATPHRPALDSATPLGCARNDTKRSITEYSKPSTPPAAPDTTPRPALPPLAPAPATAAHQPAGYTRRPHAKNQLADIRVQ